MVGGTARVPHLARFKQSLWEGQGAEGSEESGKMMLS